jgi:hypothetical protein
MDIIEAIKAYIGLEFIPESIKVQDDGNGPTITEWDYADKIRPSLDLLEAIYNQTAPMLQFAAAKEMIVNAEINIQKQNYAILNNTYVLDCSDATLNLVTSARDALTGTGQTSVSIIDNYGKPGQFTIQDLDRLLGNANPSYQNEPVIGELTLRRLDLHNQTMDKIGNALRGEAFDLNYV